MSLIQDALKKVQDERNKISESNSDNILDSQFGNQAIIQPNKKRYVILGSFLILIIVASIIASFMLNETKRRNRSKTIKVNIPKRSSKIKKNIINSIISKTKMEGTVNSNRNKSTSALPVNKKKEIVNIEIRKKKFKKANYNKIVLNQFVKERVNKKTKKKSKFEILKYKGQKAYSGKSYLNAAMYFRQALRIKKNKILYIYLYKCYKRSDNIILLKAYIIDALKYYKNDAFFNKILGILLFREKNYSEALSVFNSIPKSNNIDIDILSFKALCLFHLKEYKESIWVFKNILKLDRKKIASYYYIGLSYDNIRNYELALYYYNVFIKYGGNKKNFKHINWIRNRIVVLERSEMN